MQIATEAHRLWLFNQGQRLLDFSKNARVADGFCALDGMGEKPWKAEANGILTARMTHSFALGALLGIPGCHAMSAHGVDCLLHRLNDPEHGGWRENRAEITDRKQAYLHAFIALAGATCKEARIEGGNLLLNAASQVLETHFWSEAEGVVYESFSADWQDREDYRGANANMHTTEAMLALSAATGDIKWLQRAIRILERFVHHLSRQHEYCMAEHFDAAWNLLPDYNIDRKTDPLRPYGLTPGHFAEWAHLTLKAEAHAIARMGRAPEWMCPDAEGLFRSAVEKGWCHEGRGGIVYTIDWERRPCVTARAHWVQAETIVAADILYRRTGHEYYREWYQKLWDYVDLTMIDPKHGSWFNEVDAEGVASGDIYPGKADLYHAFQCTLSPLLPIAASLAEAIWLSKA